MDDKVVKLDGYSDDIASGQIEKLYKVFPEVFAEDKIDWNKLQATLGKEVDLGKRYGLSWKGKADVFRAIQERTTKTLKPAPEESVNPDTTKNLFIEGDNLEALKILHKSYYGKVKMIYIDPPYNTGNDFVYNDKFAENRRDYQMETGEIDDEGFVVRTDGLRKNSKDNGYFHSNWLNMMYPRLFLARNFLRPDGVIFVSIDDNEVANLRLIMDEIFGAENFIGQINWKGRGGRQDSRYYAVIHEYILCYAKSLDEFNAGEEVKEGDSYPKFDKDKNRHYKTQLLRKWGANSRREDRPNLYYPIKDPDGNDFYPKLGADGADSAQTSRDGRWRWALARMTYEIEAGNVEFQKDKDGEWIAYEKMYEPKEGEEDTKKFTTWIDDIGAGSGADAIKQLFDGKVFDYPKPVNLVKHFIRMADVADSEIVVDFFAGSGTTAQAVMELNAEDGGNRKWILVQLPEETDEKSEAFKAGYKNIADISKERIRRAGTKIAKGDTGFKVYKVSDSNFKKWREHYDDEGQLRTAMLDQIEPLIADATEESLLTELLLKNGISPMSEIEPSPEKLYKVSDNDLIICLAEKITNDLFAKIITEKPSKVILLDTSFANDSQLKANILLQAEQNEIDVEVV
ncbi:MAG: site-specific DNA-methyltransferase [Candidatus Nomurabacteria bacterium]|jgi:adenine-specific DNA-methyltransferase|nr:site-specific DNA-methyltransferase [Candidatus Nomurabacteria bacterium]